MGSHRQSVVIVWLEVTNDNSGLLKVLVHNNGGVGLLLKDTDSVGLYQSILMDRQGRRP